MGREGIREVMKRPGYRQRPAPRAPSPGWLLVSIALLFLLPSGAPQAATILVRPDGSGDQPSIQAAMDEAVNGDLILLADGIFTGAGNRDVDYQGKAVTIRSEAGDPTVCIIDCQGSVSDPHRGFFFHFNEGASSSLQDVTVRNGYADDGGAIVVLAASPTIERCAFESNTATRTGGAVLCGQAFGDNSAPSFRNCTFSSNSAVSGGAVAANYSLPAFTDCTFTRNSADLGGSLDCFLATPKLWRCLFVENTARRGGAVRCSNYASPEIISCTFYGNSATENGSGIDSADSSPSVDHCIIAKGSEGAAAVYALPGVFVPFLSCCDIWGNAGGTGDWVGRIGNQLAQRGNFRGDPMLCDPPGGKYGVAKNSPCAPENSPSCGLIGALSVACDEVPVARVRWGTVRGSFR